jgi:hypothetical protein
MAVCGATGGTGALRGVTVSLRPRVARREALDPHLVRQRASELRVAWQEAPMPRVAQQTAPESVVYQGTCWKRKNRNRWLNH